MPNSFVTPKKIAVESLPILENNLVLSKIVYRDLDSQFANTGDTITVRKPAVFVGENFDTSINVQGVQEGSVSVKLDKIATVDVEVTSKELTLDVEDFNEQITKPAMAALAQKIDTELASIVGDLAGRYGTPGTTPNSLRDIAQVKKILDNQKVPLQDRYLVVNPDAAAEFEILDAFSNFTVTGDTDGLREASLGRKLLFDIHMSQNIASDTYAYPASGFVEAQFFNQYTDIKLNGYSNGKPHLASVTASATIQSEVGATAKAFIPGGSKFICNGVIYTVNSDTHVESLDTVGFEQEFFLDVTPAMNYPMEMLPLDVTFINNVYGVESEVHNAAFHRNALCLASRPLAPAQGVESSTAALDNGLSVRVTIGYNQVTKKQTISFDCLYGVAVLYPELGAVLLG